MRRCLLFLTLLPVAPLAAQQGDVLILGGSLVDGTGAAPRSGAVVLRGDRIAHVGSPAGWTARDTIRADGMVVAPGFVDPHVHAGELLVGDSVTRAAPFAVLQGVTTLLTGNDGGGSFAVAEARARLAAGGSGVNVGFLVGHGAVRGAVVGSANRTATPAELDSMRTLVAAAMREGAFGLSSGLYYAPGAFAPTREVVALARVAAQHGGYYDTHLRDESSYTVGLLEAVREALTVGREAGIAVHLSHVKALGPDAWDSLPALVALVRAARAGGMRVTADQYPWTASGTGLNSALLPRWAEAGGRSAFLARLADPDTLAAIRGAMRDNLRRRGGAGALLLHSVRGPDSLRAAVHGRTLAELAAGWGMAAEDAALAILRAGGASVASFNMREADVEALMREPWVMTGSDGSGGHPRKYASHARKLEEYVLRRGVLTLERFVAASSGQVARTVGLVARGELRAGWFADVIVFDPAAVRARATYLEPARPADGMAWVFVNGVPVVARGVATGALPGRALARGGA